jgi:aspartate/methionine/tyrosine aminotransferase
VNNIAQRAAIAALKGPNEALNTMREAFERRRDLIVELLQNVQTPDGSRIALRLPEGAFYACTNITPLLDRPLGPDGDVVHDAPELAKLLLEKILVATVPMDSFGIPNHLRFSYAMCSDDIREGITRLIEFAKSSPKGGL